MTEKDRQNELTLPTWLQLFLYVVCFNYFKCTLFFFFFLQLNVGRYYVCMVRVHGWLSVCMSVCVSVCCVVCMHVWFYYEGVKGLFSTTFDM